MLPESPTTTDIHPPPTNTVIHPPLNTTMYSAFPVGGTDNYCATVTSQFLHLGIDPILSLPAQELRTQLHPFLHHQFFTIYQIIPTSIQMFRYFLILIIPSCKLIHSENYYPFFCCHF